MQAMQFETLNALTSLEHLYNLLSALLPFLFQFIILQIDSLMPTLSIMVHHPDGHLDGPHHLPHPQMNVAKELENDDEQSKHNVP